MTSKRACKAKLGRPEESSHCHDTAHMWPIARESEKSTSCTNHSDALSAETRLISPGWGQT